MTGVELVSAVELPIRLTVDLSSTSPIAGVAIAYVVAGERDFVGVTAMLPGLTTVLLTLCSSNSTGAACCALIFFPGVTVDSCLQVLCFVDILQELTYCCCLCLLAFGDLLTFSC